MQQSNNRKIANNTLLLYFRMFITLGISLFTSRIVLNVLGIEDYGVYTVVGGVVILFSFLNTAMATATQRFLTYEMGKDNIIGIQRVFSMSMTMHIFIALFVVIVGETLGLWFLKTKLNIPIDRMDAAIWVFHFIIISFFFQILRVPYQATVIAHEKMGVFAIFSVTEVLLKLMGAVVLIKMDHDRLILYSMFVSFTMVIIFILYIIYSSKKSKTCIYKFFWDTPLFKKLFSFTGWTLFGAGANVATQQGLNFLLNIFGGVTINAAVGVANQLSSAVYGFVANFQIAFNPQIVKSYASSDWNYFYYLLIKASKFSFFLLLIVAFPVILNTEFLLNLWLHDVPEYATLFCRLIIVFMLIDVISGPLWMAVQATGKIKRYQIFMGLFVISNLPLSYLFLRLGFPYETVFYIRLIIGFVTLVFRIIYMKFHIGLSLKQYSNEVFLKIIIVIIIALPIPIGINQYFSDLGGFIGISSISVLTTITSVFYFGLNKQERESIIKIVKHYVINTSS